VAATPVDDWEKPPVTLQRIDRVMRQKTSDEAHGGLSPAVGEIARAIVVNPFWISGGTDVAGQRVALRPD
jgi:hypothetical protein